LKINGATKALGPTATSTFLALMTGLITTARRRLTARNQSSFYRTRRSKHMMAERLKIPLPALLLSEKSGSGAVDQDGQNRLNILAYSGGIIRNHWYWGNLGIDLKGLAMPKETYPILEGHRTDRKMGHFSTGQVRVNGNLRIEGATLLDTEASREFKKLSQKGFPYEASIYAVPTEIERVERNESAQVNGLTLVGPGTVWRRCTLREVSICVFGHDSETKAEALSQDRNALSVDVFVRGMEVDEDERWIRDMLALARRQPEHLMPAQDVLAHNDRVKKEFMTGEGIFAEE
jgi:hypothetical protein